MTLDLHHHTQHSEGTAAALYQGQTVVDQYTSNLEMK